MRLIYRCPICHSIIETLEVDEFNEESLGLNILTEEEKKDIIKVENYNMYIDLTCDECSRDYNWEQLIFNQQIH